MVKKTTPKQKPWEVAGLSKSTYYRMEQAKKRGVLAKKSRAKSVSRSPRPAVLVKGGEVFKISVADDVQPLEQGGAIRQGIDLHPADRVMVDEFIAVFGPVPLKRFDRRSITGGMVSALITVLKFHGYGPDPDGN